MRRGDFTWPADRPLPWSDAECAAFARGHRVRPSLGVDGPDRLPGTVEPVDGHAVQRNA